MLKTLIVDDIAIFRETFKSALHDRFPDIMIEEAVTCKETILKTKKFLPDIVFLDIRLPEESGIKLIKKIKTINANAFIIILTDYDLPEYREAAYQNGADDFYHKGSLKMRDIEDLINNLINTRFINT